MRDIAKPLDRALRAAAALAWVPRGFSIQLARSLSKASSVMIGMP